MMDTTVDQEVKVCYATFYQSDLVRLLLGDVFHPGGLALTRRLGDLDLDEGKRLARWAVELIEDGVIGYTLVTARKE